MHSTTGFVGASYVSVAKGTYIIKLKRLYEHFRGTKTMSRGLETTACMKSKAYL